MKLFFQIIAITIALFLGACTAVPSRFTRTPDIDTNCGYTIEAEDSAGFYLETFYVSYSFIPNADDNIQNAKGYFIKVANHLAQERSKTIQTIIKSQLRTDSTRNIMDGNYAINVAGRVDFAP